MASSAFCKFVCAVLMCMVVVAPYAEATINCGTVTKNIAQCVTYLKGGDEPSETCCDGVRTLSKLASTPDDKKAACSCIKSAASSVKGIDSQKAASLPTKCGVTISYAISPNTDCSKYGSISVSPF